MAVHASSVISTAINTFDSALYIAITNIEEWTYDSGVNGGYAEYNASFTSLSNAIVAWMAVDRTATIRDFIQILFGYKMMVDMFSVSDTYLAQSDADLICNMNSFRDDVQGYALSYYDDYPSLTNINADIALIAASWAAQEQPEFQNLTTSMRNLVTNQTFNLMFASTVPLSSPTRDDMATYIFTTLHYKEIFDNLNTGSLVSPI